MKIKEKSVISKNELAYFLQNTAKNILQNGDITICGNKIELPDEFELILKSKEKNGRRKIKIEIVLDEVAGERYPKENVSVREASMQTTSVVQGDLKAIKKNMEKTLFAIERSVKSNQPPQNTETRHFLDLVQAFKEISKPQWLPSIEELQTSTTALSDAVASSNYSLALEKIAEIRNLKNKYHKIFK